MNEISTLLWTQFWQVTVVAIIVLIAVKLLAKDKPHLCLLYTSPSPRD